MIKQFTFVNRQPDAAGGDLPRLHQEVAKVVQFQRDAGIDIVNEGELTKGGNWVTFINDRLSGFEQRETVALVSLQIGFNDVFAAFKSCETEVETEFKEKGTSIYGTTPEAAVKRCLEVNAGKFQHVLRNIDAMLFAIRNGSLFGGVNYTGKIIVDGYYDPYGAVFAPGVELKPSSNALFQIFK